MKGNVRRDTRPERMIRSLLHENGLRFRVDYSISLRSGRPIRPDVVFTRRRVAVFIDGCFWHGCPEHGRLPKANGDYWSAKLELNRRRDLAQVERLTVAGWLVLRFWEHEPASSVAEEVASRVRSR